MANVYSPIYSSGVNCITSVLIDRENAADVPVFTSTTLKRLLDSVDAGNVKKVFC